MLELSSLRAKAGLNPSRVGVVQLSWEEKWTRGKGETAESVSTSVLELLSPVVGAVFALHAEVDVGADAAVVERLHWPNVVAHAQEDLRRLVLAQEPQGVHLG